MKKMMMMVAAGLLSLASQAGIDWQAKRSDKWLGYTRQIFEIDGIECWVVEPKTPRPGNPWVWCTEWPDAFTARTGTNLLLEDGFYYLYAKVGYMCLGGPTALKQMDSFYAFFTGKGLNKKGTLTGVSRGGFYAFRFAWQHPERVICLYGDHATMDFKSWPMHLCEGRYEPAMFAEVQKVYGFKTLEEALSYKFNPVDILEPIAKAKIPLILVIGEADTDVAPEYNSNIVEFRYKRLGGEVTTFRYPQYHHHPHGVDNPRELVNLIEKYTDVALGKK